MLEFVYRNTGEFMMSRYREVAEIVLRFLEHRDRLVRLSITSLLPRIAHFLRDRFVTNYLTVGDWEILWNQNLRGRRDMSSFLADMHESYSRCVKNTVWTCQWIHRPRGNGWCFGWWAYPLFAENYVSSAGSGGSIWFSKFVFLCLAFSSVYFCELD